MSIIEQVFQPIVEMLVRIAIYLIPAILIPVILVAIALAKKVRKYKSGTYYKNTKTPYFSLLNNTGKYGEYLTYQYLKSFEDKGAKFLFNVYIPKENDETSEIDVIMIHQKGIFVFESKNYSGWIFGNENQKNWYQTLPRGRGKSHKEHFYNPIKQNRTHIKHLKAFLGEDIQMWSIITFSDRCTLKDIKTTSEDVFVINRYDVSSTVSDICNRTDTALLSENDIADIYDKLYPCTQVDEATKQQHIADIQSKMDSQSVKEPQANVLPSIQDKSVEQSNDNDAVKDENIKTNDDAKSTACNETIQAESNSDNQPRKCPKCNAELVLRTATRGANAGNQFYGCSNYPKCRYIENIE